MKRNKLLLLLALLLTAATGAWATDVYVVGNGNSDGNWLNGVAWDPGASGNKMTEQNGVYSITYKDVDANSDLQFKFAINGSWDLNYGCTSWGANELNKALSNLDATGNNIAFALTEKADVTISFNLSELTYMISTKGMKVGDDAATGYTVSLKDGVKDADKWTVKVGDGQAQALPIGGLKGDGSETVTLQYNGRLKVKGVKATSDAAPAEAPATPLDNTITAWTAGTFAVPAGGLTYSDAITVSGDVTLVLTDGQTLTLNKGISLDSGATLTIQGNGTMNVNGTNESTASTVAGTGTLVLTSGTLTVKGGNGGSVGEYEDEVTKSAGGIAINGAVTVSGGTLTATGGNGGAGGSGQDSRAGAGAAAISGDVTVSGGTLTATGGNGGSFSGDTLGPDGYAGAGGTAIVGSVTITDGTVTATGGNGGSFTISNYGYALYAGNGGAAIGGNATLTGGTLNQTNGTNGTLGGSGTKEECSAGTGGKAVAGTMTNNGGTVNQ